MLLRLPGALPPATLARWSGALAGQPGGSLKLADALPLAEVLQALAPLEPLQAALRQHLGTKLQLVASQCWVRRAQPAHQWHQDGALHFDFNAGAASAAALLTMLTCWIALDDCGVDAPGLQWLQPSPGRLLLPDELRDESLRGCFDASAFMQPALGAGEALLFGGALVHRTYWQPTMTRPRTSIELRFIAAGPPPARLAQETLRPIR
jgi:ectoine hydroxylase-related dioxygenase (phytanoyl-CoA dioxygenase family)